MRNKALLKVATVILPIAVIIALAWKTVAQIAVIFLFAGILAYLLLPVVKKFEKRIKRKYAIIACYSAIVLIVAAPAFFAIPVLKSEIKNIMTILPTYLSQIENRINEYSSSFPILKSVIKSYSFEDSINGFVKGKMDLLLSGNTLFFLEAALLVPVISYYFLKEREKLSAGLMYCVPEKFRERTGKLFSDVNFMLREYLSGILTIVVIVSLLMAGTLFLFRFKNWLVLGIIMGVLNVIPYIGPVLGSIPILASAAAVSLNRVWVALLLILLVQQLDNLIVQPRIISQSVKMHPITVLVCVLVGSGIGSLPGMLLAIPGYIILRIFVQAFYRVFTERKRNFHYKLK